MARRATYHKRGHWQRSAVVLVCSVSHHSFTFTMSATAVRSPNCAYALLAVSYHKIIKKAKQNVHLVTAETNSVHLLLNKAFIPYMKSSYHEKFLDLLNTFQQCVLPQIWTRAFCANLLFVCCAFIMILWPLFTRELGIWSRFGKVSKRMRNHPMFIVSFRSQWFQQVR